MRDGAMLSLPIAAWEGPVEPAMQEAALAALEEGRVVVLPRLAFAPAPAERALMAAATLDATRKNVSLDPASGALHGTAVEGPARQHLAGMLGRFAQQSTALLHALLPRYAAQLERARTSFRPAEIAGRAYAPRKDDRRLHVDAFPTRPMRGRRILRVFANVAPDGAERVWHVGEAFPDFAAKFLPRVRAGIPGQGWIMQQLRLTHGRRSAYDFIMLRLHDAAKLDGAYQADGIAATCRFPSGTVWLCFTDAVLHAAIAGHCALEQTFHLPVAAMARPELSPLRVLERLADRALV